MANHSANGLIALLKIPFFTRTGAAASGEFHSPPVDYSVRISSPSGEQSPVIEGESIVLSCDVRTVAGDPPVNPARTQYRWLFNGNNLAPEPRKYSNGNLLLIQRVDYAVDVGDYRCQVFLSEPSRMFESAAYQLSNVHWISNSAQIIHFKYPEQDDEMDLQPLPIESVNQFKAPFKLALSCAATGYPELQFDWYLNGEPIVAVNTRLSNSKYAVENNNLYIIGQDVTVNGRYTCQARNSVNTRNSQNSFVVKVKQKRSTSLELKSISDDQIVHPGQAIILTCEFFNHDRIHWYSPTNSLITNSSR